jgi:phospholipid-binding lipoprotein MlaA
MNRSFSALNHAVMLGAVDPVSRIYRLLIPKFVRQRVQKFGSNILYPRRLVANLLQGKWREARDETYRFGINTTLGVAGFFDAASRWGLEPSDEDFGRTFAAWGWRPSTFVVLPGFGPSTVRDGIGLIPDSLLNPASYFFPAGPILTLNEQADFVEFYKKFTSTTSDPYHLTRLLYTLYREARDPDYADAPEDTAQVQTLQSVFLTYKDPNFPQRMKTGHALVPSTARKLPYSYRMQSHPAPMLFLVPGLGSHRLGDSTLALAEMAWNGGFSVAIISSSMNFEFMAAAGTAAVPGHAPSDARDVHVALDAIDGQLASKYPERITRRALMGYSLGAFHALFIAASEGRSGAPYVDFDRYITLDAPVNLFLGMNRLDDFYNAPLAFTPDERPGRVRAIIHKAMDLAAAALRVDDDFAVGEDISRVGVMKTGARSLAPTGELPFSNLEAEFLIGLNFRILLQSVIYDSQERFDQGVLATERGWFRRTSAYEEIADYSFSEYMYGFVLPYYRDQLRIVSSAAELVAANDLHSIEAQLRDHPEIRHFANTNDFLTTDEDVAWLTRALGAKNVRFFERGGHLGGLHRPEVQAEVMESLADLVAR